MPKVVFFSKSGVGKIANDVRTAAEELRIVQTNLDNSMNQLKNSAFKGVVGDEALANYENVVKDMVNKMIARAEEYAKDLDDTSKLYEDAGLASP